MGDGTTADFNDAVATSDSGLVSNPGLAPTAPSALHVAGNAIGAGLYGAATGGLYGGIAAGIGSLIAQHLGTRTSSPGGASAGVGSFIQGNDLAFRQTLNDSNNDFQGNEARMNRETQRAMPGIQYPYQAKGDEQKFIYGQALERLSAADKVYQQGLEDPEVYKRTIAQMHAMPMNRVMDSWDPQSLYEWTKYGVDKAWHSVSDAVMHDPYAPQYSEWDRR